MRRWFDFPLRTKGMIVVSIPLLCIVFLVSVLSIIQSQRNDLAASIQRAFQAGSSIQAVITLLVDAETGTRGYLLTKDPSHLTSYYKLEREFARRIERLRSAVAGSSTQVHRVRAITALGRQRMSVLKALTAAPAPDQPTLLLQEHRLREAMEKEFAAMRAEEAAVWIQRTNAEGTLRRRLSIFMYAAAIVSVFAGMLATALFVTGISARLQLLRFKADRLARGEPMAGLLEGSDEIGQLSAALASSSQLLLSQEADLRKLDESRKRTQEQLADRSRMLELILDSIADGVVVADPDFRFTVFNPAAQRMFAKGATETSASAWPEEYGLFLSDQHTRFPSDDLPLVKAVRGEAIDNLEIYVKHEGQPHGLWARVSGRPLRNSANEITGGVVVCHDITELKAAERSLRDANQALHARCEDVERATELKSAFLASMSHELRTPLNAIIGFSGLLAEGRSGPLTEKQRRQIGHVQKAAEDLLRLINEVLDLAKVESGQLNLKFEIVDLAELVHEVAGIFSVQSNNKQLSIEKTLAALPAMADRARTKQVLYNLIGNAIKFTPEGGRISIKSTTDQDFVRVSITDTGVGISEADQKIIFDEFRQAGDSGKGVKEGTGLGLAIAKRLVEGQHGTISVESTVGVGSTFSFSLPRAGIPERLADGANCPSDPANRDKPLILVTDDDESACELLVTYLAATGYQTITATSGEQAFDLALRMQPDAITLDLLMPPKAGFDVLHKLKTTPATVNIPVIVISVIDKPQQAFLLGAADYLVKPVARAALVQAMRAHLPRPHAGPKTVLIADDHAPTREMIGELLEGAGYAFVYAKDGTDALRIAAQSPPDVLVLDLLMPGVSGFDVIARMKQSGADLNIPILVVTGKDLSAEDVDFLAHSTNGFLQKGNENWRTDLLTRLASTLDRYEENSYC